DRGGGGNHALQLSGDGSSVDDPPRPGHRKRFYPEALRANAPVRRPADGTGRRSRCSRRGVEFGARGEGGGERPSSTSGNRRRFLRGLPAGGGICVQDGGRFREASSSLVGSQKPSHCRCGCPFGKRGSGGCRFGLWLRRAAVYGR